ncbi:MAG: prolyl oligopeptidase family serine peptidase [Acidobacteria bacterium]|nr:prolyl oligopeptidase family serine peptidase [Acidobacteriota bacterium]
MAKILHPAVQGKSFSFYAEVKCSASPMLYNLSLAFAEVTDSMRHLAARTFSCFTIIADVCLAAAPNSEVHAGITAPWTVEDMVARETADEFRISPEGNWVVWVKSSPDAGKDEMVSNLFLTSLTEKREVQLTRGADHNSKPRWSRSGRMIAFLSDRPVLKQEAKETEAGEDENPTQVWLLDAAGGEPWPLTRIERGVKDFDWIDEMTILIAAEETPTNYLRSLKDHKDRGQAIDDPRQSPPVRLFKVSVKNGEITRLTTNDDWVVTVAVSTDGRYAAVIHARSLSYEFDEKIRPVIVVHDLATGKGVPIHADVPIVPWFAEAEPQIRWTGESSGFYFVSHYSTHPVYRQAFVDQLFYYELSAGKAIKVDLGWERELGLEVEPAFAVIPNGFVALLADGVRFKAARYLRQGSSWQREWLEGDDVKNLFGIEITRDGRTAVYRSSAASSPEQLFQAAIDGNRLSNRAALTHLNSQFAQKTPSRSEVVRWKGALGEEVEGLLFYPQIFERGKKFPLLVMIHGGPLSMDLDAWDDRTSRPMNLYTQRGSFVFTPNYHGSGNYGLAWAESIGGGKYYELEVPDIEKGVDALIARGLVDPERLGVMGWSNGGILTVALTVASTRYKAASSGAGNVEQTSDWSYVKFGAAFDNYYFGATPLDDPQLYLRKSPLYDLKKVRTPTIVFSGSEDRAVGHAQGWMHFRTLQQLGQTDVRFVVFPGEEHGLKKLAHRRRKVEEELAWFEKYLLKTAPPANEAVKDNSPLAQELKRRSIMIVGTNYGMLLKSTLVPEVVPFRGLELGRFELTRAQFAAFDKNYRIEPGTENYPANNISFSSAQAYCTWLSKTTGENFRLGKVEELESIYREAQPNENTLDYWAGYSVNPDDAARLREKIGKLGGAAPLLKEVGSFPGRGNGEMVFDLGGNVAEWVVDKDGSGKLLGGSADQPSDPHSPESQTTLPYTGFRVVKGP